MSKSADLAIAALVDEFRTANLIAQRNYLRELHIENPSEYSDAAIEQLSITISKRMGL